ncbi:siderophore-interacting protein [Nocardia cerradoensis]|uniref:siderophore-interacting protein n=1 Tax=Nocardia cerradoensis TaxID=85688 RepID=UPI0002F1C3D6|nr:siderophore-interacting protein [Nocardia cerradoensis]
MREFRPAGQGEFGETAELDIDFAMHGGHTPACGWAANTTPGTAVASGLRRHLANERGIAKADITFTGYWRFGKSAPG